MFTKWVITKTSSLNGRELVEAHEIHNVNRSRIFDVSDYDELHAEGDVIYTHEDGSYFMVVSKHTYGEISSVVDQTVEKMRQASLEELLTHEW